MKLFNRLWWWIMLGLLAWLAGQWVWGEYFKVKYGPPPYQIKRGPPPTVTPKELP